MSKQVNKTIIGAFVIGAIALIVMAVVIVGSGKFFHNNHSHVFFILTVLCRASPSAHRLRLRVCRSVR